MSTANYRTQSFHDARNKILELTNEKKIKSKEDLSKILEEEGYEVNDFLNEENNSPMKTHGQRTLMFLNASVNSLIAENKPKYVSVERL